MAELGDLLVSVGVAPKVEVTTEMMDYAYVDKCSDKDTLRAILAALKSGKEGHFPHLIQHTEQKLLSVLPEAERKKIQRLKANPTPADISEAEAELSSWSSEIAAEDKRLSAHAAESTGAGGNKDAIFYEPRHAVRHPVRGRGTATVGGSDGRSSSAGSAQTSDKSSTKSTQRISGYDFRAWEKFDVDKALEEMDKEEQQAAKARDDFQQRHRAEEEKRRRRYLAELDEVRATLHVESMSELQRQKMAVREKEKGNECFKAAEYEQAHWFYTRSIALDNTNAAVFANRAIAAIRLERFEAAEHDCTMALELSPSYTKAYLRRGMARYRRGRYGPSLQDFQRALELEPGNKEIISLMEKAKQKFAEVEGIEYDAAQAGTKAGGREPVEGTFRASDGQQTRRIIAEAGEPEPLSGWTRSVVSKGAQAGLPYGTRPMAADVVTQPKAEAECEPEPNAAAAAAAVGDSAEPSRAGFTKISITEKDDSDQESEEEKEGEEHHHEDASPPPPARAPSATTTFTATEAKGFSRIEITEEDESDGEEASEKGEQRTEEAGTERVETLKQQGNNAMASKDYTLAVQKYSEALAVDPSNIAVRNNRALAYLLLNEFANCKADCSDVLWRDPSNVKALLRRAMALEHLGSVDAAIKDLDAILALHPEHAEALKQKKRMQEEQGRGELNAESAEWEVAQLRQQAAKQVAAGDHSKAIETFKRCLELTPEVSEDRITLYRQLATCYLALGQPNEAVQQLELLLQVDPKNLKAKLQYASLLVDQGRYEEARAALADILRMSPNHAEAMALLDDLSTRRLGKEIELDPAASDSFKQQGNTLLTQGDVAGAIDMYSKSLAANPQNLTSRNNRAMAYLRIGKYAEAEADCNVVLAAEPANVKALFRRASARKELGNLSAALADLEKVEAVEPGNSQCSKLKKEVMDLIRQAGDRALAEQKRQQPQPQQRQPSAAELPTPPSSSSQTRPAASVPAQKAAAPDLLDLREVRSTRRSNVAPGTPQPPAADAKDVAAGEHRHVRIEPAAAPPAESKPAAAATETKAAMPVRSPSKPRDLAVPTEPPSTLYELERVWRTLKGRPDLFARYLRTFKTTTLKKVLKQAATPELLTDMLQTTNEHLAVQHPKSAVRVLQGLARCASFSMMVALMFDADKQAVKSSLEKLRAAGVEPATLDELEREYGL